MRVIVEVYREAGGRLTGTLQHPDGSRDAFASTLDLLRADGPAPQSPPAREASEPESEVSDD
jgi:hypothetical protein